MINYHCVILHRITFTLHNFTFQHRLTSLDEPMTPPPNYDAALIILAQSQDSVLTKPRRHSSVFRRSVSMEQMLNTNNGRSPSVTLTSSDTPKEQNKRRSIFRFSRQFSKPLSRKDYTSVSSQPSSRPPSLTVPSSPSSPQQISPSLEQRTSSPQLDSEDPVS